MVTFNPQSDFLPVEKLYCAEIVATTITNTAPPMQLPILRNSAQFDPYLNGCFRPP